MEMWHHKTSMQQAELMKENAQVAKKLQAACVLINSLQQQLAASTSAATRKEESLVATIQASAQAAHTTMQALQDTQDHAATIKTKLHSMQCKLQRSCITKVELLEQQTVIKTLLQEAVPGLLGSMLRVWVMQKTHLQQAVELHCHFTLPLTGLQLCQQNFTAIKGSFIAFQCTSDHLAFATFPPSEELQANCADTLCFLNLLAKTVLLIKCKDCIGFLGDCHSFGFCVGTEAGKCYGQYAVKHSTAICKEWEAGCHLSATYLQLVVKTIHAQLPQIYQH